MNPYEIYQAGLAGAEQGKQRGIASLIGKAYSAPIDQRQNALARLAQVDGPAAYDAQKHIGEMDDDGRQRLGQYAAAFDALPDDMKPQAYPQLAQQAQQLGIPAPPEWNPAYAPHIQKLAQTLGGGGLGGNVQSTYINAQGQRVAIMRDGSQKTLGDANPSIQVLEQEGQLPIGVVKSGGVAGSTVPIGGAARAPAAPQSFTAGNGPTGAMISIDGMDPRAQQQLAQQVAAMRAAGVPDEIIDAHMNRINGQSQHFEATPAPSVVRTPTSAEKAGAAEAAKQSVELGNLPLRGQIDARNAALKAQAEAAAKAQAERDSIVATKQVDANKTLTLLDEAEKLIPGSTGSGAGNVVDAVAGMAGYSTEGAKNIAALQTIAGQLTSSMPRMQGPQSDKDVQLYRQMAGDLANPNLPRETRLAALRTIRRLNRQYAGGGADAPPSNKIGNGGWSIQRVP